MNKKIQPKILRGTRDFLPQQMMQRNSVMDTIRTTFEQFGYSPIETPIICPADTILGKYGEEGDRLTYAFTDRGGRRIALPYDLTVPFARYVAANYQELPIPFKRYQIQRVWRAEKPQKGRLREFYQCDVDIIGSKSLVCEAEIARIITTVFTRLGIESIVIKFNSRRLMNAVLTSFKVPQSQVLSVIRLIDKMEKIGEAVVIQELTNLGLKNAEGIIETLKPERTNSETLRKLSAYDISELEEFLSYCRKLAIPEEKLQLDPTLARGLDYYTGLTFEVVSKEVSFGTLCAGGRYDNLCALFSEKDFSGVGVAFGFERIMLFLDQLKLSKEAASSSLVLVTTFDESSVENALDIYNVLIEAGIPAEMYFEASKLAKQFKYADKKLIPFVVIQGPEEKKKGEVTVKRMRSGKQKTIPLKQLVSYISGYYEAK